MHRIALWTGLLLAAGCSASEGPASAVPPDSSAGSPLDGASHADAIDEQRGDAAPDAALDALAEATSDASTDAATDVTADTAVDVTVEAAPDGGSDSSLDAQEAGGGALSVRVTSGDDAVSSYLMNAAPPAWNIFSGDTVPVGRHSDPAHVSYYTAFRFVGVAVPKGAAIASARLRFHPTNEVDSTQSLWLNVYAELATDSAPFDPTNYDSGRPDQRARTTSFLDHVLIRCNDSCTDLTEYDCPQRKLDCWDRDVAYEIPKDLSAMLQEVVDQPGWAAGHALTILLVNAATDSDGSKYQGHRSVTGFDLARGAEYAPELAIALATP